MLNTCFRSDSSYTLVEGCLVTFYNIIPIMIYHNDLCFQMWCAATSASRIRSDQSAKQWLAAIEAEIRMILRKSFIKIDLLDPDSADSSRSNPAFKRNADLSRSISEISIWYFFRVASGRFRDVSVSAARDTVALFVEPDRANEIIHDLILCFSVIIINHDLVSVCWTTPLGENSPLYL